MKNFIKAFLVFLFLALIAALFTYLLKDSVCNICYKKATTISYKKESDTEQPTVTKKTNTFTISDMNGNSILEFPESLLINSQNDEVTIPESMKGLKDSIFNYLKTHQGEELVIKANYLKIEGEDVGLGRANYLKNILSLFGINKSKIIPKAILSEYSYDEKGNNNEGISMVFQTIPKEDIGRIEKSISHKILYTKFGSTEFKPDRNLQGYAVELKEYLNKYPNKSVSVTGHTDNVGKTKNNYELGLKRAKTVITYLISHNIDSKRMKAYSKGEDVPVASNDTEEGKSKNRRIVIEVK